MSKRVAVLAGHFPAADGTLGPYEGFPLATTATQRFPPPAHDVLRSSDMLKEEELRVRDVARLFAETEVAPIVAKYWETATFPHELVPKLGALNLCGLTIASHGSPGLSPVAAGMVLCELARVDASVSTFLLVHSSLGASTIAQMGSEEQKNRYLPDLNACRKVACWALTEPEQGSDASALKTTATKTEGGWILDGQKRWIGNGTFADVTVVWARNTATGSVNAFLVEKDTPGLTASKIENKIALRCVQNADITLRGCFVPDSARLPGVDSFADTAKVLQTSRVLVSWLTVGIGLGVYDAAARYVSQRQQFGRQLAGFGIIQEKLMRMLGGLQASWLLVHRASRLREEGRLTAGKAGLVKGWVSRTVREVAALGRELLGGNGIVTEFHVAKAFCDLEAIYTYEGTYDINMLLAGRENTGVGAIKPPGASGV
eukprot:CAMPEP_0177752204 /NCGR_PEP_ID=MMETSP0491_2-20121128/793_1 /TAXON_ID=63592 /ORGANISM="Tetraselmis chuii, Strain PLY429" /LENGTH=430 /DNA_ID=CAMNT_0019267389 /DNA_START=119 /DNA_END=1411 /DNA_ORIENTATION=+